MDKDLINLWHILLFLIIWISSNTFLFLLWRIQALWPPVLVFQMFNARHLSPDIWRPFEFSDICCRTFNAHLNFQIFVARNSRPVWIFRHSRPIWIFRTTLFLNFLSYTLGQIACHHHSSSRNKEFAFDCGNCCRYWPENDLLKGQ